MPVPDSADSGTATRARQALPPIRTLLGDELALGALPPLPSSHSSNSAASSRPFWDIRDDPRKRNSGSSSAGRSADARRPAARSRASTISAHHLSPHPEPHDTLPPPTTPPLSLAPSSHSLPPSPAPPARARSSTSVSQFQINTAPAQPPPYPAVSPFLASVPGALPHSAPPYSYNILRPSPDGGLVTAPPTPRRPHRTARSEPATMPSSHIELPPDDGRRHVCPTCQKRFNRPSSLRTHQSVHTGLRPFTCPHPACARTFSVASNMRRHLRGAHPDTAAPPQAHEFDPGSSDGEDVDMDAEEAPHPRGLPAPAPDAVQYFEWASAPPKPAPSVSGYPYGQGPH